MKRSRSRLERQLCFALCCLLTTARGYADSQDAPTPPDPVLEAQDRLMTVGIQDYNKHIDSKFSLFVHNRTFLIPYSYIRNPSVDIYEPFQEVEQNNHPFYSDHEAEFQLSFFLPVSRNLFQSDWDFMVAYTHHSWWQVYNARWSKPFRETNYNPELFFRHVYTRKIEALGVIIFGLDLGYMHESNGQIQLVSRSWDRLFARIHFLKGSYTGILTTWIRVPEDPNDDDNPHILKYRGLGKVELNKSLGLPTLSTEINLAGKPGVELSLSYPLNDSFRWFFKMNRGYGQSLIEYDRDTTRFGVGIRLESYNDKSR